MKLEEGDTIQLKGGKHLKHLELGVKYTVGRVLSSGAFTEYKLVPDNTGVGNRILPVSDVDPLIGTSTRIERV